LRTLGQHEGSSGFEMEDITLSEQVKELMETRMNGFAELKAVRHSARVEGWDVGWEEMPKPLGTDEAKWLNL